MASEGADRTTRQWTARAAGLPCMIEYTDDGYWVVVIASTSTSRGEDLTATILEAGAGLVTRLEAGELAAAVGNPPTPP
jgi:hypothetical protein